MKNLPTTTSQHNPYATPTAELVGDIPGTEQKIETILTSGVDFHERIKDLNPSLFDRNTVQLVKEKYKQELLYKSGLMLGIIAMSGFFLWYQQSSKFHDIFPYFMDIIVYISVSLGGVGILNEINNMSTLMKKYYIAKQIIAVLDEKK